MAKKKEDSSAPVKKKVYKEKYYALEEEDMQALISKAQTGNSRAQSELLEIFSNFLSKYTTMIYYDKYSLADYDIRRFISMYVKDRSVGYFLMRNKLDSKGVKHVSEVMRGIHFMTLRYCSEEDVDHTVKLAFLTCLQKYKRKDKIPFSGYLYSYYFYVLKKMVDAYLIGQLGRKTYPLIYDDDAYNESDNDNSERQPGFVAPASPEVEELIFTEEIDELWVAGDTCSELFKCLTVQERQIIKWRYVDTIIGENGMPRAMRSSDIAYRITEHSNTLREHMARVKEKLRNYLESELEELLTIK